MRFSNLLDPTNLAACFSDVRRRSQVAGIDGITPDAYACDLERRLVALSVALGEGSFRPSKLVRVLRDKPDGGVRRLSIPTVEDRIVLDLLRRDLEPRIQPLLSDAAYAYRPRRSARAAVEAVQHRLEAGDPWAALADIRDFFDTVPLEGVVVAVQGLAPDEGIVRLLRSVLERHAAQPGRGLAQGSALSPLLSNLVLTPLDRTLTAAGLHLIRYCDNLCIPSATRSRAEEALAALGREVTRLGLSLKPNASRAASVQEGFLWLGFWLGPGGGRVSDGAVQALRARLDAAGRGLTGEPLRARLRPILDGWVQYFDAPLPEGASLGDHDAIARGLVPGLRATAAHEPAPPGGAELADEGDAEQWHGLSSSDDLTSTPTGALAEDVERLLNEADRRAASGDYDGAETAYEAAQHLVRDGETRPPAAPAAIDCDDDTLDAFLGLFCAGQDSFEAAPKGAPGRRDFAVVGRPPGPGDVREHLAGRASMAVRPRLPDGRCTLGVIDLDGSTPQAEVAVRAYAQALASVARAWGWQVLREETGGRGVHLWFPVSTAIRARDMARSLALLERAAGAPADAVHVERLPGDDDAPELHQQAMTLPLGAHVETGARSRLSWVGGEEIRADLRGLFDGRAGDAALFASPVVTATSAGGEPERARTELPAWSSFGANVARVMEGCPVLRHLAEKAAATGHLAHGERLSLLYSLGHLGPPGEQALHAIIGACQNYSAPETSRQIARLSGLPIGCTRVREKHATQELLPLCCCDFGDVRRRGGYPTPLLHAAGFRRTWRDTLKDRRQVEARVREEGIPGVVAAPEESLAAPEPGALVRCAPPHEWA